MRNPGGHLAPTLCRVSSPNIRGGPGAREGMLRHNEPLPSIPPPLAIRAGN